jgi:hypothetical protein
MQRIENTVFIRYRSTNKDLAKAIYDLRANGYNIFIDRGLFKKEEEYEQVRFEAICGNTDQAVKLLKAALDKGSRTKKWLQQDPHFEDIRDIPNFKKLSEQWIDHWSSNHSSALSTS